MKITSHKSEAGKLSTITQAEIELNMKGKWNNHFYRTGVKTLSKSIGEDLISIINTAADINEVDNELKTRVLNRVKKQMQEPYDILNERLEEDLSLIYANFDLILRIAFQFPHFEVVLFKSSLKQNAKDLIYEYIKNYWGSEDEFIEKEAENEYNKIIQNKSDYELTNENKTIVRDKVFKYFDDNIIYAEEILSVVYYFPKLTSFDLKLLFFISSISFYEDDVKEFFTFLKKLAEPDNFEIDDKEVVDMFNQIFDEYIATGDILIVPKASIKTLTAISAAPLTDYTIEDLSKERIKELSEYMTEEEIEEIIEEIKDEINEERDLYFRYNTPDGKTYNISLKWLEELKKTKKPTNNI